MLKLLILGIGFMLLIEGALYGLFPKKMKKMMQIMINLSDKQIKNISLPFCLIGFCLIYFTVRE
ncbi:MAG: hypothetical protein CFH21_00690 [Alphaproteobacteria bacterium MarineAlpha5_Bin11]|nr:ubiquitin-binding protein [Pelagibacteraceae bacterium]PPR43728.1 MAG: hypothetical protein CFH21_00690 [Alphaproteobacteria bacterium MarineAlpha5_Bin11]PPR50508.1 MAG: hypothetical protein CFH20_00912 [Alphaproteobacteria bacterium MarineAlpha5_Bin10]|tara:strand:- start:589 stop:780 length:192 start_codon:yes stop_codon:yes gene_type:complete